MLHILKVIVITALLDSEYSNVKRWTVTVLVITLKRTFRVSRRDTLKDPQGPSRTLTTQWSERLA